MNRIEIENLHFSYQKGEEILKGINLTIGEESTAIIGQNGAGKTTLVKLLKGLLRPDSGRILFNGKDIAELTVAALAKDIGLIFQNPNDQIFKNTVLDEVMFGPLQIGMDRAKAESVSREALKLVGLEGKEKINPYDLGLSDRKMVSIAGILAMDTRVIIFDEPTIAQDISGKKRIQNIIKKLQSQGKIVISILHDMDFVAESFDRVIVFAKGQALLDGSPKEVFTRKDILEEARLEQPYTMQLGYKLGYEEAFLSPEEFVDYLKEKRNTAGKQ